MTFQTISVSANKSARKQSSQILVELIKKKIDLSDFMETEAGCRLKWYETGVSAGTLCPMPSHRDSKPSFRIKLMDSGIWIFHCLGCGVKGTIIDFCMEYFGMNFSDTVLFLCKKYGFKESKDLVTASLKDIKKKSNLQKKMEYTHIVTSNQCRTLLRKNYDRYSKWVGASYRKMNEALDKEDVKVIEAIGNEASKKMQEKV
jgi:DNA primase